MSWRVEQWWEHDGWKRRAQFYLPLFEGASAWDEVEHPATDLTRNGAVKLASRLQRHGGMFRYRVRRQCGR